MYVCISWPFTTQFSVAELKPIATATKADNRTKQKDDQYQSICGIILKTRISM